LKIKCEATFYYDGIIYRQSEVMKKRERNVTEYTPMRSEVIVGGNFTRQDTK